MWIRKARRDLRKGVEIRRLGRAVYPRSMFAALNDELALQR